MRAPYQITRIADFQSYNGKAVWYYVLENVITGRVWDQRYSISPIAPADMRRKQGLLNTSAVLD